MANKQPQQNKKFKKAESSQTVNFMDKDIWDDTILIKAYDESLKLAQSEVAKRIARSTNTVESESEAACSTEDDAAASTSESTAVNVGDYVRATYDDDIDYEARVLSVDDNGMHCQVKYIGYDNEQTVEISKLLPSWGKKARKKQKQEFLNSSRKAATQNVETFMCSAPPPPPLPPMLADLSEDSEHLSAMLMSWYMSGYYTGVYQGRRMAAQSNHR